MRHAQSILKRAALSAGALVRAALPAVILAAFVVMAGCASSPITTTTGAPVSTAPSIPETSSTETSETSAVSTTSSELDSSWPPEVQDAVNGMTLQAKAAQVLLVSFDGTALTDFTRNTFAQAMPGGVLVLGRNVTGEEQLRALTAELQEAASSAGAPGLFVAADEEGGSVMRVREGVPEVPAARTMAVEQTADQAGDLAEATAAALLAQGVNMVLAPVADVVADADSFLFARSYGSDPGTVSDFVAAVSEGFVSEGLATVVKHFPGHGSAPQNSHTAAPVSPAGRTEFESIHLPPFRAAIAVGADGVMIGHFVAQTYDPDHPASQSAAVIEGLLRKDLGFEGLVISDDLEMAAAAGRAGEIGSATPDELGRAAVAALAAGCDLLITTGTFERQSVIRQAIVDAVSAGTLSEERLDEAVARILNVKLAHGLPVPEPRASDRL